MGALSSCSSSGTGREGERKLQSTVASVVSASLGEGRRCEPKELKFCQLASAKGGKQMPGCPAGEGWLLAAFSTLPPPHPCPSQAAASM